MSCSWLSISISTSPSLKLKVLHWYLMNRGLIFLKGILKSLVKHFSSEIFFLILLKSFSDSQSLIVLCLVSKYTHTCFSDSWAIFGTLELMFIVLIYKFIEFTRGMRIFKSISDLVINKIFVQLVIMSILNFQLLVRLSFKAGSFDRKGISSWSKGYSTACPRNGSHDSSYVYGHHIWLAHNSTILFLSCWIRMVGKILLSYSHRSPFILILWISSVLGYCWSWVIMMRLMIYGVILKIILLLLVVIVRWFES